MLIPEIISNLLDFEKHGPYWVASLILFGYHVTNVMHSYLNLYLI